MMWFDLPRIGLMYDIAGVIALSWGFLLIGPRDFAQAQLMWREKGEIAKLAFAKIDAWFGVALITLGFLGQLLGSDKDINAVFLSEGSIAPTIALAVLVVAMTVFVVFRGRAAHIVVPRGHK